MAHFGQPHPDDLSHNVAVQNGPGNCLCTIDESMLPLKCSHCHHPVLTSQDVCPECGTPIGKTEDDEPRSLVDRTILHGIAMAAVAAAMCGACSSFVWAFFVAKLAFGACYACIVLLGVALLLRRRAWTAAAAVSAPWPMILVDDPFAVWPAIVLAIAGGIVFAQWMRELATDSRGAGQPVVSRCARFLGHLALAWGGLFSATYLLDHAWPPLSFGWTDEIQYVYLLLLVSAPTVMVAAFSLSAAHLWSSWSPP